MLASIKKMSHGAMELAVIALLLVCTLTVNVIAVADLSGTIGVTGLTANSSGAKDWTASAGGAVWEGKTSSSGGCSPTYTATDGTLEFKNNSGSTQVLSFSYTLSLNGGSFTIANESKTANGSYSATLANGASVTLVVKSSSDAANTTKVTLSNIKLEVQNVNITFAAPTNGSYTMNGTKVTANTTVTNPSTTTYKLVATPAANYYFAGWYLGDTKVYDTATVNAASFATSGTITAKFLPDPLYNQATVTSGSSWTKDQLISSNTWFIHDSTSKLVADGSFPGNNSAYSRTAASKTKDKIDVQYIPSTAWSDSLSISYSGTAMGDYVNGPIQESYAYARVLSDVIRVYAKENCNVSFDYSGSFTTGGSSAKETDANAYFYIYITTADSATISQIKGGTVYTGSGSTPSIALSAGQYLYILAEGYARNRYQTIGGGSQFSMTFDYTASISNFTVSYNEKKDILSAGFRDNTGKVLGSGTISVNNAGQAIGSNGNMTDMTFADQAAVTLAVGTAPANYVHIGWEVTPEGGSATRVYTPTYTRTLTENVTVNALFVPKTIITMGANGYTDATYTDVSGTALSGQYVARNADCTAYYTTLADAFSKTDVVVLLAGATINGAWTIPAGKTFVIPYGMNDKGNTTPDLGWGMGNWDYCLVNLNGNLNVAGTLIVSAQQNQSTGATGGNPGHLVVASGKTITVSGSLYAYGPITGSGSIETTSTANIHETLEFSDNAPVMYIYNIYNERSSKKVSPFNAMFINSIEIPVTYQLGATLTAHAAVRYDTPSTAAIPIIAGSGAMLNHTAGTITKYYDASAGQFVFRSNSGSTVNTGSFSITLTVTVAGRTMDITMNSADYYIPLAAPYRFEVAGQFIINDNYKLLPGMTIDVEKGGTLTIASGKNLILYRGNDYDYRGKHANSTEQWGYGEKAYPINPQRFNGVNYPFSFNSSNMGSAKLNVDGELIVNGGLYVTNELQTAGNGITLTANGYNYLTGSGSIDMTNATTDLTSINEVMRAQGTNDLKWDTVAVVPIKGLKADATADEAAQYVSLTGKVFGFTNANGLNAWSTDPCAGGHDWNDATCTTPKTCTVCGATEGEALGHVDIKNAAGEETPDHRCDHCNLIMYYATNVRLGNSLDMMFAFPNVFTDHPDSYYIKIVRHYADGTTKEETYSYANDQWTVTTGYIYFTYTGLSAKEMCDKIEVTLCTANGDAISVTWVDSIRDYAMRLLDKHKDNEPLRTLLVDMLNYGAACQNYFGYGKDDLANALLSETQVGYASKAKTYTQSNTSRPGWVASQLVVESNISYNIVFAETLTHNGETLNTEDLFVRYTYTGHKGNTVIGNLEDIGTLGTVEIDGTKYRCLTIAKMVVADAAETDFAITVTITNLQETIQYAQWTDSIKDYTARQTDTDPVYGLFMQFAESAYTYLHSEERIE